MVRTGNCPIGLRQVVAALATLLAALFLQAGPLRAQQAVVPQFEVAGEYSYIRAHPDNPNGAFNLNGGIASFCYNVTDRFSAVGEFNATRFSGLPNGVSSNMYTYLFGPRFSMRKSSRWTPFVHTLLGVGRVTASAGGVNAAENALALAAGGGLDLRFHSRFSLRLVQADYLLTRFNGVAGNSETQNDLRISAGIVFRFGSR